MRIRKVMDENTVFTGCRISPVLKKKVEDKLTERKETITDFIREAFMKFIEEE